MSKDNFKFKKKKTFILNNLNNSNNFNKNNKGGKKDIFKNKDFKENEFTPQTKKTKLKDKKEFNFFKQFNPKYYRTLNAINKNYFFKNFLFYFITIIILNLSFFANFADYNNTISKAIESIDIDYSTIKNSNLFKITQREVKFDSININNLIILNNESLYYPNKLFGPIGTYSEINSVDGKIILEEEHIKKLMVILLITIIPTLFLFVFIYLILNQGFLYLFLTIVLFLIYKIVYYRKLRFKTVLNFMSYSMIFYFMASIISFLLKDIFILQLFFKVASLIITIFMFHIGFKYLISES